MYEDIRNAHFSKVSSYLSQKAKALQTGYEVSKIIVLKYSAADIALTVFQKCLFCVYAVACGNVSLKALLSSIEWEAVYCIDRRLYSHTELQVG